MTSLAQQRSTLTTPTSLTNRLESASHRASDLLWPTLLQHWRLWPAVHTLNFYYVPLHHRILVQNTVLMGWSGYLSYTSFSTSSRGLQANQDDGSEEVEINGESV
jgi:Mpv17 / PMP22 family